MKIEYQREAYREIISEEFVSKKFDAFTYKESLKASAAESQGIRKNFKYFIKDSFQNLDVILNNVLKKSHFQKNSIEYKRLKISIILNSLNILKNNKKLDKVPVSIIL